MTLLVRLVHHVDAVAVTQFVKIGTVGVVAGAQEIDVRLLHQPHVQFISRIVHPSASARMMVVAVHTTQFHTLPVNLQHFAHNLHFLHAQMIVEMFCHTPLSIRQFHTEGVEVRLFCRPQLRLFHVKGQPHLRGVASRKALGSTCQFLPIHLQHSLHILHPFLSAVAKADVGTHLSTLVVIGRNGSHPIVGNVNQWAHPQLHLTEDAAESPHVLAFQITAVTPAIHLHSKSVLAFAQMAGHIKFGWRHGVLAISHLLAIHPYIECGMYTAKMKDEVLGKHLFRYLNGCHIRTHGIAVVIGIPIFCRLTGDVRAVAVKGVAHVDVDGFAVTLHLPVAWHGDVIPCTHVEVLALETNGA